MNISWQIWALMCCFKNKEKKTLSVKRNLWADARSCQYYKSLVIWEMVFMVWEWLDVFQRGERRMQPWLLHEQVGKIFYWNAACKSQLKPKLEPYKASPHPTTRKHARPTLPWFLTPGFAIRICRRVSGLCVFTADLSFTHLLERSVPCNYLWHKKVCSRGD